jgi:uncharacterized protein YggE
MQALFDERRSDVEGGDMKARSLGLASIAGAMILAGGADAQPMPHPPMLMGTRLDIVAEGAVARPPDVVTISAGVVTEAPTAGEALRQNAGRMATTIAALKRAGIADRDVQTSSISLNAQYRYMDGKPPILTGYQASNQVSIRFRDIKRAGAILDTLVAEGANQLNGPSFSLDQPEAALDEARADAIKTARARAELYAKAAGLRVKRIISISEAQDYSPPARPMMMAMAPAKERADTSIEAGEQRLAVNVSVSFELE